MVIVVHPSVALDTSTSAEPAWCPTRIEELVWGVFLPCSASRPVVSVCYSGPSMNPQRQTFYTKTSAYLKARTEVLSTS